MHSQVQVHAASKQVIARHSSHRWQVDRRTWAEAAMLHMGGMAVASTVLPAPGATSQYTLITAAAWTRPGSAVAGRDVLPDDLGSDHGAFVLPCCAPWRDCSRWGLNKHAPACQVASSGSASSTAALSPPYPCQMTSLGSKQQPLSRRATGQQPGSASRDAGQDSHSTDVDWSDGPAEPQHRVLTVLGQMNKQDGLQAHLGHQALHGRTRPCLAGPGKGDDRRGPLFVGHHGGVVCAAHTCECLGFKGHSLVL